MSSRTTSSSKPQKSRHYVNVLIQDPRNPKTAIVALVDVRGAKDEKEVTEVIQRAIPKSKIENITKAEVLNV